MRRINDTFPHVLNVNCHNNSLSTSPSASPLRSEIEIIPPLRPCTSRTQPSLCSIRILWPICIRVRIGTFDVLERELSLELVLEDKEIADELVAGLLEDGLGCYGAVGLDLDDEVWVKWVRDFVPCEQDLGHGEELTVVKAR